MKKFVFLALAAVLVLVIGLFFIPAFVRGDGGVVLRPEQITRIVPQALGAQGMGCGAESCPGALGGASLAALPSQDGVDYTYLKSVGLSPWQLGQRVGSFCRH